MKLIQTVFLATFILCILGCSKHPQVTSAKVSLRLLDATESATMEAALTSFASKNGFNSQIYSNHEKWPADSYKPFIVEYENRTLKGFNVIAFQNRIFYPTKEGGGCLIISVVADDRSTILKTLLKELTDVIHANIHDHRTVYVDTECGARPPNAIE